MIPTAAAVPRTVAVVGGGLAGVSAALSAAANGGHVTLIEKTPSLGGNSAKATSGVNGCPTAQQAEQGVADSVDLFAADTLASAKGGHSDPLLLKTLVDGSAEAVAWLVQQTGLKLDALAQLGGHSRPRAHRERDGPDGRPVPVGFAVMRALGAVAQAHPNISVLTSASVVRLHPPAEQAAVTEKWTLGLKAMAGKDGAVVAGIPETISTDSVVLTTGGFANDRSASGSLLKEYRPDLFDTPTTNGPWATGDGVKLARDIGVELVDMDKVQLHPTGLLDPKDPAAATKFLAPEALRGVGGVLLAPGTGGRFTDELGLRKDVTDAILALGEPPAALGVGTRSFALCVLDETMAEAFGVARLKFYASKGFVVVAKSFEEVAVLAGGTATADSVRAALAGYNAAAEKGKCDITGKTVFPRTIRNDGTFYVARVTPCLHYTMGGVAFDAAGRVLRSSPSKVDSAPLVPMPALFAAGEVTGGLHGGNRLGGNSLLECVVFGRIAGGNAAVAPGAKPASSL